VLIEGAEGLGLNCEGHLFCVDVVSMAPLGGVWGSWWTVPQLSHAVQEVVQRLPIFCLSLEDLPMDLPRVGRLGGGCLAGFLALGEDLIDVVVVFHALIIHPADDRSTT